MDGYEMFHHVREVLGDCRMLDELESCLSDYEMKESAEWIARMYDIEIEGGEEDE